MGNPGIQGYVISALGWSFLEPIRPKLVRLGLDKATIDEALSVADHIAYNAADVLEPDIELHDEPEGFPVAAPPEPPAGLVTGDISLALWGDDEYRNLRFGGDNLAATSQMELIVTMMADLFADVIPNNTDAGFTLNLAIDDVVLNTSDSQCPSGTGKGELLQSSFSCSHQFPEPDIVHVFSGVDSFGGLGCIRGLIQAIGGSCQTPGHTNHSLVGWTTDVVNGLRLSLHEFSHNIGAVHGSGDSDWAFLFNQVLVGDFSTDNPIAVGRDDILVARPITSTGDMRWHSGDIGPLRHFEASLGSAVIDGPADMRPGMFTFNPKDSSGSLLSIGSIGDTFLGGDFTGDGRYDLAIGNTDLLPPLMTWSVAEHRSDKNKFLLPFTWSGIVGTTGDTFLAGDFTGDGLDDIAVGAVVSPSVVEWSVAESNSFAFLPPDVFSSNAGSEGDTFIVGDFNGDGIDDLLVLNPITSTQVFGFVSLSTGNSFNVPGLFDADVGEPDDQFLVGDFDNDGTDDFAAGHSITPSLVEWEVWLGTPTGLLISDGVWATTEGTFSRFHAADVDGDGDDDLVRAFLPSGILDGPLRWETNRSAGASFAATPDPLARDVCITWAVLGSTALQTCDKSIMLYSYGYSDAGVVPAFSRSNALTIIGTLNVFNSP